MYLSKENHLCLKLQHLAHCFSVRIELVCARNTSCNLGFSSGDRLSLFQIGQFSWVDETHVSLERNPFVIEAVATSTLFPVRIELVVQRNTSCKSDFSSWRKGHFIPNRPIQLSEETHILLQRKPSVLEAGASSTSFPCENWVRFCKEYFLQHRCFKVEIVFIWYK
jgi:hypothetical protein